MTLVGTVGEERDPEAWKDRKLVMVKDVRANLKSELN